jgi:hypothetical protein
MAECEPYNAKRLKEATMTLAALQRKVTIGELCEAENLRHIIEAYEELAGVIEAGTGGLRRL